jgi:hypothetical protein
MKTSSFDILPKPQVRAAEFYAKFVGYAVDVSDNENNPLLHLDVVTDCVSIHAGEGFISVSRVRLQEFVATLVRKRATLLGLDELPLEGKQTHDRFAATNSRSGLNIEDRITGGGIHLREGGSIRELVKQVKHTYCDLKDYIPPCFKIARCIDRLPYEEFIAAIARDGYSTVHYFGIARLSIGHVDYRPEHRVAKIHRTDDERQMLIEEIT